MADTHYATYAQVQYVLANSGLGTAGNSMYDLNALDNALDVCDAMINLELDLTANNASSPYAKILMGIEIDLVTQFILRARMFKEMNLADAGNIQFVFSQGVAFTDSHLMTLDVIRQKIAVV